MRFSIVAAAVLLSAAAVSSASAQATHQRAAGDTLRFLQTTTMSQAMEGGPMGAMNTTMSSVARLVVAFGAGDTITAWLDSATSQMSGPTGDMSPDVSQMLNKKQVVTLSPTGELTIITAQNLLPPEMAGMSELMPETLHGLELQLPTEPLRKGVTWTDTTEVKSDSASVAVFTNRTITRYEVVSDSTIAGRPVLVIDTNGTADIDMDMPVADGAMNVKGKTSGVMKGRIYYAPQLGLLLKRTVTSDAKGNQEITGQMAMSVAVNQKSEEMTAIIQ